MNKKKQQNKSFFTASLNALKEDACLTSKSKWFQTLAPRYEKAR